MSTRHDFHLPITTEATLHEFVKVAWGVDIPDVQVCLHHSTPFRAFCDAYFARSPVSVWWASRGLGGKSFLLSLLANTEAVTLGASVSILGGSGAQSKRVLEHINGLWNYKDAPRGLLKGEAATITRLNNGASIEALMASQTSIRGGHNPRLRLDEIDEMDIKILDAAQGQPMEQAGVKAQTVMSSTRQYAGGTMDTILDRAEEKGWSRFEWCYKENLEPHGWLTHAQVAQKKFEVTDEMWNIEYENQTPPPPGGAIFHKKWWDNQNRYDPSDRSVYNKNVARWLFWDTALDPKETSDRTAFVVFELTPDYKILLRHVWSGRLAFPQLVSTVEDETLRWLMDDKLREVVIENKSSGISALQTLEQASPPEVAKRVKPFNPGVTSKSARMTDASLWCDRGCVLLPTPHESVPWLFDFEEQLFKLPAAKFDDEGDAFTIGILYLKNLLASGWQTRTNR